LKVCFTIDKFQTFQGLPLFPKQFKDFFSFPKFKDFSRLAKEPCDDDFTDKKIQDFSGPHEKFSRTFSEPANV